MCVSLSYGFSWDYYDDIISINTARAKRGKCKWRKENHTYWKRVLKRHQIKIIVLY